MVDWEKNGIQIATWEALLVDSHEPSLPRVVNFEFVLQPHQKYYITQNEELGFSSLTQMKDDYTADSHYLTYSR